MKSPITIWLEWWINKTIIEYKYRKKHVKIGYLSDIKKCKFGKYDVVNDNSVLWKVEMGDFSYVGNNTHFFKTKIGKFCSIATNVICGLGKHPSRDFVTTHPMFFSTLMQQQITFADKSYFKELGDSIVIGNDVWIGVNAIISSGITIGDGAIIGAGAMVTKDVPPYAIVGGVPAKIIRYRFTPEEIQFLLELKWWDKEIKWLKENYKLFHDIKNLQNYFKK